jgi:hypothetical protein
MRVYKQDFRHMVEAKIYSKEINKMEKSSLDGHTFLD